MSKNSNDPQKMSEYNKNVINYQNKMQAQNNYCTVRTINEPRDNYNEIIEDYIFLQDRYVNVAARKDMNNMNGNVGCLGCDHQLPTCTTQSALSYPDHVGVESKLFGL